MLLTVISLLITCGIVQNSEIHQVAPAGSAPIVTAASSQYFERTFNRLVAAPPILEPIVPVAHVPAAPIFPAPPPRPFLSVLPIGPSPPVVVEATKTTLVPTSPTNPPPAASVDPNIAIAIATARAAPVATILLPPYPFGFPPSFGIPQGSQTPFVDPNTRESTTLKTTTVVQATTSQKEEDATTPLPSDTDINFAQASSSNENVNFRQYLAPQLPTEVTKPQSTPAFRPQEFSGSNARPQQFPVPSPRPQQFPMQSTRPQQFPVQSSGPQQFPVQNSRPQQFPVQNPRPQQFPVQSSGPQQFPVQNSRPQQFPVQSPRPQQFPVQSSRPQQWPIPNTWPQQVPQHLPLPDSRPIKFKTNVEVVPVPLAYIAPPSPLQHHHHDHHHHQHHHHHHQSLRTVPHKHKYIPKSSKIIVIRPVTAPRIRTVRVPAGFATYGPPKLVRRAQNIRSSPRETEPTTFRPINRFSRPPRL